MTNTATNGTNTEQSQNVPPNVPQQNGHINTKMP